MHVETWCRLQNWPPYLLMANPLYHKLFQEMNICQCEFCYSCMILCWSTRGSWNCPQQNREPVSLAVHVQYYGYWNCWWPSSEKSQGRALHICPFFFSFPDLQNFTKTGSIKSRRKLCSNPFAIVTVLCQQAYSVDFIVCTISFPAFWWIISLWPGVTFTGMDK